jgi:YD repeat-containing protein
MSLTAYDGLSRVVSQSVGTSDSNVVLVSQNVYDEAGVGDGNRTQVTEFPGSGEAPRLTQYYYDWRNRLVASKAGIQSAEDTTTHRPISYTEYDNLNQAVAAERYDGDAVTPTVGNDGVPVKPAASLLRARSTSEYDDQGRVFRSHTYSVNQTTGDVSTTSLTTDTWYDRRGNTLKTSQPGGLVTKTLYDGAGRAYTSYTTDGLGDRSWVDAATVTNNNVLAQTVTQYDNNGNSILVTSKQRFHDDTTTGTLGSPTAGPLARVSYVASYYDAADRMTARVDIGTNGGQDYTRPPGVPDRSDMVLVTSYGYNDAGWVESVTDPRGLVNRTEYDNLRRTLKTIDAYTDGVPTDSTNRTTGYNYDGNGHVLLSPAWPMNPFAAGCI